MRVTKRFDSGRALLFRSCHRAVELQFVGNESRAARVSSPHGLVRDLVQLFCYIVSRAQHQLGVHQSHVLYGFVFDIVNWLAHRQGVPYLQDLEQSVNETHCRYDT